MKLFATICFWLVTVYCHAELIGTVNHKFLINRADLPLTFRMEIGNPNGVPEGVQVDASPSDVGTVYDVFTPELGNILIQPRVLFDAYVEGAPPQYSYLEWDNQYVGYEVNGLEARIDRLNYFPQFGGYGDGEWTLLIYGDPMSRPDMNADGVVDAADYVVLRKAESDFGSMNVWGDYYNRDITVPQAAMLVAVPEPSMGIMILVFCVILMLYLTWTHKTLRRK